MSHNDCDGCPWEGSCYGPDFCILEEDPQPDDPADE